jgi:hypothetical protein
MSMTSLLIAAPCAYAGKPDPDAGIPVLGTVIESPDHIYPWEMQRVNATEWAEDGAATRAFNHLQDDLGRPHIDDVWYDFDSDYFHLARSRDREPDGDGPGKIRKGDFVPLL